MGKIRSFMDLIVWQKADDLFVKLVMEDVPNFPKTRAGYVLTDQLIRCVGSISSNIAEGFGRKGPSEFTYHLGIARGEANQSFNWYHKCGRIMYLSEKTVEKRKEVLVEIQKMLSSLISKIDKKKKVQ